MKRAFLLLLLPLCGCEWMNRQADHIGSYMPVLSDERCEHWQCFTDEGKAQSERKKMMMKQQGQQPAQPQPMPQNWEQQPAPAAESDYQGL